MKECKKCLKIRHDTEFHYQCNVCKKCHAWDCKLWREKNKEKIKEKKRKNYDPEKQYFLQIKSNYGILKEDYFVLQERQGNICAICKKTAERLYLDHNHSTGEIRGLLCGHCNTMLGMSKDDPIILQNGIDYLKREDKTNLFIPQNKLNNLHFWRRKK